MKFIKKHLSVHVLRKENIQKNLDVACWNHPNLIPHTVPSCTTIHRNSAKIWLDTPKYNKWNHLNVQRSDIWFHAQMIHLFYSTNIFSSKRQEQHSFPLRHILLQCSLARVASPALQSTWQECHFFHQGSVMLTQRLLNLLLALINALFLHGLQLLATPLSLHLSGHQVWCSNAATFQPPC